MFCMRSVLLDIHSFIHLSDLIENWKYEEKAGFMLAAVEQGCYFFYLFVSALGEKVFFSFSFFIDWFDLSRQRRQWLTNHRNMGNNMYLISKGEHLNPGVAAVLHFILTAFICAVLKVIWYKIGLSKTNVQKTQTRIRHETHMCSFTWNSLIHFFIWFMNISNSIPVLISQADPYSSVILQNCLTDDLDCSCVMCVWN